MTVNAAIHKSKRGLFYFVRGFAILATSLSTVFNTTFNAAQATEHRAKVILLSRDALYLIIHLFHFAAVFDGGGDGNFAYGIGGSLPGGK